MTRRSRAAGALVVGVAACMAAPARADLPNLANLAGRVAEGYQAGGGRVVTLPARFLYEDETVPVRVPPAQQARCVTVALVAARGLSFHVHAGAENDDDDQVTGRTSSVAGALELASCDGRGFGRLRIKSDAGRGALEVVVAYSDKPMPALRSLLPERVGGPVPPAIDPGALPPAVSPEKRAESLEARTRDAGGTVLPRGAAVSNGEGAGIVRVTLEPGCHRIGFFSTAVVEGKRKVRLDVDADLRDEQDDTVLARDRGEASDAHLDACVGARTVALASWSGAAPGASILVARGYWPLPEKLPRVWGPAARARMASALRAHGLRGPRETPVALYEGVAGETLLGVPLEAGACFVGVVAVTRGTPHGMMLRAEVGGRVSADDRGTSAGAALVAFCTRDHALAHVTVDARGASLAWGLALYRVARGAWEEGP